MKSFLYALEKMSIQLTRRVCAPYRDLLRGNHNVVLKMGDWKRPTNTLALVASPKFNELLRFTADRSLDLYASTVQGRSLPTKDFTGIPELTPYVLDVIVNYLESLPPAACQDEIIEEEVQIPLERVFEVLQAAQYLLLPPQLVEDILAAIEGTSRVFKSIANTILGRDQGQNLDGFPTLEDVEDLVWLGALDFRFAGKTALNWAAFYNKLEMVKTLLAKGADPNVVEKDGETPLYRAAFNDKLEMVKALLDGGAKPNLATKYGKTPLHWAAYHDNLEMVKALLAKGAKPNVADKDGNTPLYYAAFNDKLEMVKALLDGGADPNLATKNGQTPLYFAAYRNLEMVKALLAKDAKPNVADKDGETPLYNAALYDKLEIVKALLDAGADPNLATKDGETPLYRAAHRNLDMVNALHALLAKGANPNIADKDGKTPLYWAAYKNNLEMVKALLDGGADPDVAAKDGKTPLYWALQYNNLEMITALTQKKRRAPEPQLEQPEAAAKRSKLEGGAYFGIKFI